MLRRSLLAAAFLAGLAAVAPAWAALDPAGFINNLGNEALEVLNPATNPEQRVVEFRALFRRDFDVPQIARFVLGRYWRVATPAQQREFIHLFENYIALAYSTRLSHYGGERLQVTGSRLTPGGAVVTSEVGRSSGGSPVKIEWSLTRYDGTYKINDVVVDGISMAVTQRSEFASVIERHGGDVQGLLETLRAKTAGAAGG
ncbi:MAG TPA: ABC transporter substrate-binding protein [Stellaceae bacterium]|nr:ABC transporter substrate-binding protein [Stellaceae bacterium]